MLISGGGDPVLKVWQWRIGRRLFDVAIEESVLPFIAVRRARPKRGYDSDGERKPPSRRWLARQRRREAKAAGAGATAVTTTRSEDVGTVPGTELAAERQAEAEVEIDVEAADDDEDERDESADDEDASAATPSGDPGEPPAPVLVVQKIETLVIDERLVVVFSAFGYVPHLDRSISHFHKSSDNRSVLPRCSGLSCRQIPPPYQKGLLLCTRTTSVVPSSPSHLSLGTLTSFLCLWTHIGLMRVRLPMFPRTLG